MPRFKSALRVKLLFARSFLCAGFSMLAAEAADFTMLAEQDFVMAQRAAAAVEKASGHQLVWLGSEVEISPDIYFLPYPRIEELIKEGTLARFALAKERGDRLATLLAASAESGDGYFALPMPVELPILQADPELLAARRLDLPVAPDWEAIAKLAVELVDPLGDVHGICIDPGYDHATLLLSMVLAVGGGTEDLFTGGLWRTQAEAYTRMLAAAGPPNAARLTPAAYREMSLAGRCALRIAPLAKINPKQRMLAAVPGVAAFVNDTRTMVAVSSETPQRSLAVDLAWQLMSQSSRLSPVGIGGDLDALVEKPENIRLAVTEMLKQTAVPMALNVSWRRLALEVQAPLAEHVDGLIPVEAALERAAAIAAQLRSLEAANQ